MTEEINTIILPNDENLQSLNIGDILEITSRENGEKENFFIVTRFDSDNSTELRDVLQRVNLKKIYSGFNEIICQDCSGDDESENGVVGFRLKKFHEGKH